MGEQATTATASPPAASGGLSMDQVNAAIAAALAPVAEALKGVSTLGEQVKQLAAAKGTTAEEVKALVAAQLAENQKAAARTAARQKIADELKAKGVADELIAAHLPDSDDAAALKAGADKAIERWNAIGPKSANVGGAAKDGGAAPGTTAAPRPVGSGLTEGQQKYAAALKMPA